MEENKELPEEFMVQIRDILRGQREGRVNDKNHAQEDGNQGLKIGRRRRMEVSLAKGSQSNERQR